MSDQTIPPKTTETPAAGKLSPAPGQAGQSLFPLSRSWKVASVVGIIMIVLALLGVGLTTTSPAAAHAFWIALVPVYGALCVGTAWERSRLDPRITPSVFRQVLHWVGIAIAIGMDFIISGTGEETRTASGYNALLLLALGCYLAGVHLEWLFAIVGVLLTLTLIIVVKAQQYVWLIFVAGALAVAAMVLFRWFLGKRAAHEHRG
jgi:hypothetical protein